MEVKILLVSMGLMVCFLRKGALCLAISQENNIWEEDLAPITVDGAPEDEFYRGLSTGPEKLPIAVLEFDENGLEEETEKGKLSESVVDEEAIRKAEKAADKDLLNGLNRILKNNETLKDVFRTENVYEIP